MTHSPAANTYDELPFPVQSLPQSRPDRMAAVAALFGLESPPADRCRVLELGCAAGGNLIPMADRHPECTFVGIDYSQVQVAAGQRIIEEAALANIELLPMDIADVGEGLGTFDYIVAHGLLSWVDPRMQERILEICASRLNPRGVAYVSYNTLPGWHHRGTIRELVCRCAPPDGSPQHRVTEGRKLLQLLTSTMALQPSPHGSLLATEIDQAARQPDGYLFHDYFEADNYPLYFHEFVSRATRHGLQYLGESVTATMFVSNFGPRIEELVMRLSDDVVSAEQHLDVLRNRPFRQTLLCHQEIALSRQLSPQRLQRLYVSGRLRPQNVRPDLQSSAVEGFIGPNGLTASSPDPVVKAALHHLGSVWPRGMTIDELVASAATLLSSAGRPREITPNQREALGHNLVQCLASGLIDLASLPDNFVASVSPQPRASRLARVQARAAGSITNLRHESVALDEASRTILQFLDGKRDHEALLRELVAAVDRGEISIMVGGIPATRGKALSEVLTQTLQKSLNKLAACALLVA